MDMGLSTLRAAVMLIYVSLIILSLRCNIDRPGQHFYQRPYCPLSWSGEEVRDKPNSGRSAAQERLSCVRIQFCNLQYLQEIPAAVGGRWVHVGFVLRIVLVTATAQNCRSPVGLKQVNEKGSDFSCFSIIRVYGVNVQLNWTQTLGYISRVFVDIWRIHNSFRKKF